MRVKDESENIIKGKKITKLASLKKHAPKKLNNTIKKKHKMSTMKPALKISDSHIEDKSDIAKKKNLTKLNPKLFCTEKPDEVKNGALKSTKTKPPKIEQKFNVKKESSEEKNEELIELMNKEYYPGMISDLIQIKTHGRVIVPWDPSFGLDPTFKRNKEGNQLLSACPLKINPAFDLSKRTNNNTESTTNLSDNKVFVGNLPSDTSVSDLKKLFKKCGLIHKAKIMNIVNKQTKKLKSEDINARETKCINASIVFKTFESCESALKMNGRLYKEHHLRVNFADRRDGQTENMGKTVFIGNLSYDAHDDDLWRAFEDCGLIESVRIVRDRVTGKTKGFGYVIFKSAEAADRAVEDDGKKIVLDRRLRVEKSDVAAASLSNLETVKKRSIIKKKKKIVHSSEHLKKKKIPKAINDPTLKSK